MTTPLQLAGTDALELLENELEEERVDVDRLEDVDVVVIATCVMMFVDAHVSTPPSPVEQEDVDTVTLMLRRVDIVTPPGQVTMPPRPVEQDVTLVTLCTVVVDAVIEVMEGRMDNEVTEPPSPPKVPLKPAPAVKPAPKPAVAEAPTPMPFEPMDMPTPTLAPNDTDKLAPSVACKFRMVLLEAPFNPTPPLNEPPAPPAATMQPFNMSPPFVQVVTGRLLVVIIVAPTMADVKPLVFTETVALTDSEADGTDVLAEPTPLVPVERLTLVALPTEAVLLPEA